MESIKNKVALVTGGAMGIGKATALLLGQHGAKVMVTDINKEKGQETAQLINDAGGYAKFYTLDVSKKEAVTQVCKAIFTTEGSLDLAVNNAGVGGAMAPMHLVKFADWERTIGICLSGVFFCMQEELKYMLAKGGGKIVNISSLAGLNGVATGSVYSTAKHGVLGLTRSAALEYGAYNVRINAVCPGFIQTAILDDVPQKIIDYSTNIRVPMKRIGKPEEVANTILWLLSDASSYINGENLVVDGGFNAG